MPHAVLNGAVRMEDIFTGIEPLFVRNGDVILKTSRVYMEREKKTILIDSLVIEGVKKINFFAVIDGRDDGVTIRIYPGFEVEKTNGVKRTVAGIAKQLLQKFPSFRLGATNLSEYLP